MYLLKSKLFLYLCSMKTLTTILLFVSINTFGQTNYNTILNTKKDSLPEIDLHFKKSEKLSTVATLLHFAGLVSLTTFYYIAPTKPIGFILPASLCATSIGFHFWSDREFKKSKNYLESE
jgi:hypothetical protein